MSALAQRTRTTDFRACLRKSRHFPGQARETAASCSPGGMTDAARNFSTATVAFGHAVGGLGGGHLTPDSFGPRGEGSQCGTQELFASAPRTRYMPPQRFLVDGLSANAVYAG